MRREIREMMQGRLQHWKEVAEGKDAEIKRMTARLQQVREEHNAAENMVRLIEEELQRPDGSPAFEPATPAENAGSGI